MQLSLQDYADVVKHLRNSAIGRGSEQRKAARITVSSRLEIHLRDYKEWRSYNALTKDISISGIGLLQSLPLPAGREVILGLPRSSAQLFVAATVSHCRSLTEGILAVGAEFTRLLDEPSAEQLKRHLSAEQKRLQDAILL